MQNKPTIAIVAVMLVVAYLVNAGLGKSTKQVAETSPAVQQPAAPLPQAPPPAQPESNPPVTSMSAGAGETKPKPPQPQNPPAMALDHPAVVQSPAPKQARGRNCSIDDGEIPSYLNLADRYRNSGKYDSAIRNYNLVLGCQPGNRQAQAGLRTAEEMEKYSH